MAFSPKLGRLAREHDPAVPHLSALLAGKTLPDPPPAVDYLSMLPQAPNGLGMMLNDKLGDCVCAAYYHARLIWTFHTTGDTHVVPDSIVEELYVRSCGYKRGEAGEGPGGTIQHVLKFVHQTGAPIASNATDRILGFVEVDHRNFDDIKRAIFHSGVAYIGINLPVNVSPPDGHVPPEWTIADGDVKTIGGHAIIAAGYDAEHLYIVSWGTAYKMTWDFFKKYADEAYAVGDRAWHESEFAKKHGLTLPAGLSPEAYADQMKHLSVPVTS